MSTQLVSFQGEEFAITLPAVFDAIQAALPLIVAYFDLSDRRDRERVSVVDASKVHKHVGGTYRYTKWLDKMIKDCRLTLGEDYFQNEVNPSTEEGRERIAKQGKLMTFLTLDAARKVVVWSHHDDSHLLFKYLSAAADAIVVAFKGQIVEMNSIHLAETKELKQRNDYLVKDHDEVLYKLDKLAKEKGAQSGTLYEIQTNHKELRAKLSDDLALERQKCNMLENGMKYMRSSKWKQERCEDLFAIAQSALERAEREGECYSDPY